MSFRPYKIDGRILPDALVIALGKLCDLARPDPALGPADITVASAIWDRIRHPLRGL